MSKASLAQSLPSSSVSARWGLWVLLVLLALAAVSRLASLDARPMYHDESLFALYGWQQARTGDYDAGGYAEGFQGVEASPHHPLLHGPLQIQVLGAMLRLRASWEGALSGEWVVRFPAALCGIALVALVCLMHRRLGSEGALLAAAALLVSPAVWYYSRFCRNDALFMLATLAWVLVLARAWRSLRDEQGSGGWLVAAPILCAVLLGLKENSLFLIFNAVTFGMFVALRGFISAGQSRLPRMLASRLAARRWAILTGVLAAWLLLEVIYTNGFRWDTGFPEMYADILHYWTGQHREHRLYGEYHYHLLLLMLYQPVLLLVLLSCLLGALGRVRWRLVALAACVLGGWAAGIALARVTAGEEQRPLLALLHMMHPWHLALAAGVGWAILSGTWLALRSGRGFRAWLVWWTGMSFLQYSYAGEKVPWVCVHVVLPAVLLAAEIAGEWIAVRKRWWRLLLVAWVLGCGLNLWQGWRVCFVHPTNPGEILVYNHTQPDIAQAAKTLGTSSEHGLPMVQGDATWPVIWYWRNIDYIFSDGNYVPDVGEVSSVICDEAFVEKHPEFARVMEMRPVALRTAWTPEPLHLFSRTPKNGAKWQYGLGAWRTLGRWWRTREPWGDRTRTAVPLDVLMGSRPDFQPPE